MTAPDIQPQEPEGQWKWVDPYSDIYSAHLVMRLLHHTLDHSSTPGESPSHRSQRRRTTSRGKKRSVILVAHSQSARIALNAAYLFPNGFAGIVLVNPGLFSDAASIPGFAPHLFRQVGDSFFQLLPSLVPPRIGFYDYSQSIDEEQRLNYQRVFRDRRWRQALCLWGSHHFSAPGLSVDRLLLKADVPCMYSGLVDTQRMCY